MPFLSMDLTDFLFQILVRAIVLFTALPIHEYAHGFVADKLGDPTARWQGRLTLNPFAHFNLFGSICLLVAGIGWANPVPINPSNFKNPKRGMALSALAGPVSNLLLAFLALIFYKVLFYFALSTGVMGTFVQVLFSTFNIMASVNISLAIFNLLPIPPLDGSRIFGSFLPSRYYFKMMQYENIIVMVIFVLLLSGVLGVILNPIFNVVFKGLDFLTGFVDVIAKALL